MYINKVLLTDVHMHVKDLQEHMHPQSETSNDTFFFADKNFAIGPYCFKFISVMECTRDEFIFEGVHVYFYSCELCFFVWYCN